MTDIEKLIENISDEELSKMQFAVPWQYNVSDTDSDEDGFGGYTNKDTSDSYTRTTIQDTCWNKFHNNPQINTSVRGIAGRLTGLGFEATSENFDIQEVIEEIELDPRNRLYNFWPKYIARTFIEGELFLSFTCHADGFVEVDFVDPSNIDQGGDDDTGIIFHPTKPNMPLFYNITNNTGSVIAQIPSIYVGRYPELAGLVSDHKDYNTSIQPKKGGRKFGKIGGYYRFIVAWDKGFVTRRAVSYMRTVLEWLNHYENLKKYEIDHKKSSGSYLWIFKMTDPKTFKMWLSLSDADKRKTGIMAKKTPGGTLVLPPGIEPHVINPNLTSIKDQDTDILQMIASGLNEPEDIMTGSSKGTFASVKASRGPFSDRISDEIAYFERWLRYDFWGSIFFLKNKIANFPEYIKVREAYMFDKEGEPKFKNVPRKPERLVDISFPTSDSIEYNDRAQALLGSKHGPVSETLGIPVSDVAKKFGFGSYGKGRLRKATEDERYPELVYNIDAESVQEKVELGSTERKSETSNEKKPVVKEESNGKE